MHDASSWMQRTRVTPMAVSCWKAELAAATPSAVMSVSGWPQLMLMTACGMEGGASGQQPMSRLEPRSNHNMIV